MPKKRFSENPPKITKTWVIADFAYIVPWNEYCDRPWPLIFSGHRGAHRSLWISPQNARSSYWIEPHKKSWTCVITVFGYIVPLDRVYQRPLSPGSARPQGILWNPCHLYEKSTGGCTIWSQNKILDLRHPSFDIYQRYWSYQQFGVPIRSGQAVGDEGKTPQIRHLENLESAEKAIFRKSS